MKKTLYVSDLDGTLLNSQSQISSTTKTMLNRLVEEEGINFTIATARTPATVVRLLEGVDCRLPLIVMTGAAMWKGGIVDEHYLQASEVESLSALCRKYGVRPFFSTYRRLRAPICRTTPTFPIQAVCVSRTVSFGKSEPHDVDICGGRLRSHGEGLQ